MAAVDDAGQHAALPFRVYGLEGQVKTQDAAITRLRENTARVSEAISAQAVTLAKHDEQIANEHADIIELKTAVAALVASNAALGERIATASTRAAWSFAAFALTVAAAAIGVIVGT